MEVTTRSEESLIVGRTGRSQNFRMASTAEFFHILSSALYSNPKLAFVREILCNANDANKTRTGKPFKVWLTPIELTVEDHGSGIPHEKIVDIYCTYGASTKVNDSDQTGGFGLGCKAPFAYTESFAVINKHGGMEVSYFMNKAGSDGIPTCVELSKKPVPKSKTGITVKIPLNPEDFTYFKKVISDIISTANMNAEFRCSPDINTNIEDTDVHWNKMEVHNSKSYYFTDKKTGARFTYVHKTVLEEITTSKAHIYVRYGGVIYPMPSEIDALFADSTQGNSYDATVFLQKAADKHKMPHWDYKSAAYFFESTDWKPVIDFLPDSLDLTPSRESLQMTEKTSSTLLKGLEAFQASFTKLVQREFESRRRWLNKHWKTLLQGSNIGDRTWFHEMIKKEMHPHTVSWGFKANKLHPIKHINLAFRHGHIYAYQLLDMFHITGGTREEKRLIQALKITEKDKRENVFGAYYDKNAYLHKANMLTAKNPLCKYIRKWLVFSKTNTIKMFCSPGASDGISGKLLFGSSKGIQSLFVSVEDFLNFYEKKRKIYIYSSEALFSTLKNEFGNSIFPYNRDLSGQVLGIRATKKSYPFVKAFLKKLGYKDSLINEEAYNPSFRASSGEKKTKPDPNWEPRKKNTRTNYLKASKYFIKNFHWEDNIRKRSRDYMSSYFRIESMGVRKMFSDKDYFEKNDRISWFIRHGDEIYTWELYLLNRYGRASEGVIYTQGQENKNMDLPGDKRVPHLHEYIYPFVIKFLEDTKNNTWFLHPKGNVGANEHERDIRIDGSRIDLVMGSLCKGIECQKQNRTIWEAIFSFINSAYLPQIYSRFTFPVRKRTRKANKLYRLGIRRLNSFEKMDRNSLCSYMETIRYAFGNLYLARYDSLLGEEVRRLVRIIQFRKNPSLKEGELVNESKQYQHHTDSNYSKWSRRF